MALLTPDQVREMTNVRLSDDAIEMFLDLEEAAIIAQHGPHYDPESPLYEYIEGMKPTLWTARPIETLQEVIENGETVEADGYEVWPNYGKLVRCPPGAWWGRQCVVVYVPVDDTNKRKAVLLELVRLAASRSAFKSERLDEYTYEAPDNWEEERARLLRSWGFTRI